MSRNQTKPFFDALDLRVTLPRPNYARMSPGRLLQEGRHMYTGLQRIWSAELRLDHPNWAILETVSRQMKIFEDQCPEVCWP